MRLHTAASRCSVSGRTNPASPRVLTSNQPSNDQRQRHSRVRRMPAAVAAASAATPTPAGDTAQQLRLPERTVGKAEAAADFLREELTHMFTGLCFCARGW
jgi:hypothetical protein